MKRRSLFAVLSGLPLVGPWFGKHAMASKPPGLPGPGDWVTVFQHTGCAMLVTPGRYQIPQPGMELGLRHKDGTPCRFCTEEMVKYKLAELRCSTIIELDDVDGNRTCAPRCCVRELPPARLEVQVGDQVEITAKFQDSRQYFADGRLAFGEPECTKRVKARILDRKPLVGASPDEGRWLYELDLQDPHDAPGRQFMITEAVLVMYAEPDSLAAYPTTGWRKQFSDKTTL